MNNKSKFLTDTKITGLLYLGLAVTGLFVFAFAKANIFVAGDGLAIKTNLLEKEMLARFGIAAELGIVAFQALVAVWFYKLFHRVSSFASIMLMIFGMVNAVMILVSSALWLGALNISIIGGEATSVINLFNLHELIWLVSGLFFGLWLIPMGYLAIKSNMPKLLGWMLIGGGAGYILSTFILILNPSQKSLAEMLPMLATVGEFWMIGYLLIKSKLHQN